METETAKVKRQNMPRKIAALTFKAVQKTTFALKSSVWKSVTLVSMKPVITLPIIVTRLKTSAMSSDSFFFSKSLQTRKMKVIKLSDTIIKEVTTRF